MGHNPNPYGGGNSNPGGPGGRRRKIKTGTGKKKKGCCSMVAAVKSVKRGKYRLARRYAAMSVRLIVARLV
jgi:hypothetical protein